MAAVSNELINNYCSLLSDFAGSYARLVDMANKANNIWNGTPVQAAVNAMQNGDTIGDTQATKAQAINVVTRVQEVVAAMQNGNLAKLQTLLAFIESLKAKAPTA